MGESKPNLITTLVFIAKKVHTHSHHLFEELFDSA